MKKLLIIDMQKGFINKNNRFLIKRIKNLIDNGKFDVVLATKFENFSNSQYEKWLSWSKLKNEAEQALETEIEKRANIVIEKNSYAISDEQFSKWFHQEDEVYLCGTDYDACVLAVAFQLFDHNIKPYILIDCVGSHSDFPINKSDFERICIKNFGADAIKYKVCDVALLEN